MPAKQSEPLVILEYQLNNQGSIRDNEEIQHKERIGNEYGTTSDAHIGGN